MSNIGVVIHGTNSGSGIIYISENKRDLKFNIQDYRGGKDDKTLKKRCFSISFDYNQNNFCLSKYEIAFDKRKPGSIGYVALTFVIPFYKDLNIEDILNKIDDLFDDYVNLTVDEEFNYEHETNDKLDKKIEHIISSIEVDDVSLIDNNYNEIDKNKSAFLFYEDRETLIKILQNPYHKKFYDFHQIYLLDASEKEGVNALNALKHDANAYITTEINLDNPDYTIDLDIEKGIEFNDIQKGTKVKLNDKANLNFSKTHYKTYKPNFAGSWKELLDKYSEEVYLSKKYPNTIVIKSPQFEPVVKKMTIQFKIDENRKQISYNEVKYLISSNGKTKSIENNQITFVGDEVGLNWEIKVNKNDKYRASSGHLLNPTFETSKTISLEPVSPRFNWRPVLMMLAGIILVGGIGVLGYLGYNSMFNTTAQPVELVKTNDNIKTTSEIESIEKYLSGNELIADTLKTFFDKFSKNDSLLFSKTTCYLQFRNAIDDNDRNKIQLAYDSLRLEKYHNSLLLKIIDSIDFNNYKTIENRKSMFLSQLIVNIDSIIEIKRLTEVLNNSNKNVPNDKTADNLDDSKVIKEDKPKSTAKYTNDKFIQAFSSISVNDTKLTSDQQKVLRDYNKLDDRQKKSFRDLGDPVDLNDISRKINKVLNDE